MPASSLKGMAKKAGIPYEDVERYWREAKKSAKKQGIHKKDDENRYYAYVMGIVTRRMKYDDVKEAATKVTLCTLSELANDSESENDQAWKYKPDWERSEETDPETIGEYKQAIKKAKNVYAQIRFPISDRFIKINKKEAILLAKGLSSKTTAKKWFEGLPSYHTRNIEHVVNRFGYWQNKDFYIM